MKKRLFVMGVLTILFCFTLTACSNNQKKDTGTTKEAQTSHAPTTEKKNDKAKDPIEMALVNGFLSIGAANMMAANENNQTLNTYNIQILTAPDEVNAKLLSGEVQIATVPTNMAAALYNKTDGQIKILAVNTLGVVKLVTTDPTIQSLADIKGKDVTGCGQGAIPEYVFNYILAKNDIQPETDISVEYKPGHEEVAGLVAAGQAPIATLPEPALSKAMAQNSELRIVSDLTEEWEKLDTGVIISQGCVVAQSDFITGHPNELAKFLDDYAASCKAAKSDVAQTAAYCGQFDMIPQKVAETAIPKTNQVFIQGEEMKQGLEPFFKILFEANPKSIGGKLPDNDFYYLSAEK